MSTAGDATTGRWSFSFVPGGGQSKSGLKVAARATVTEV
jgi:hypothetical protein